MADNFGGRGRGWHGDSEEHARVGAMGGRASSKASRKDRSGKRGQKGGRARGRRRNMINMDDDQL